MSRTKTKVDVKLFKRIIKEAEDSIEFTNLSKLYEQVAKSYNGVLRDIKMGGTGQLVNDIFPEINAGVVGLRIKEFGIKIKTKAGARGRPTGSFNTSKPQKRTTRAEKFQKNDRIVQSLEAIRQELHDKPHWYQKIVEGSLTTAVKAHCYTCGGYNTANSIHCDLIACCLWPFLNRKEEKD